MKGFAASGGGSKGQWHVGVLQRLLAEERTCYDAYAGVSVGALVCAYLAQYPAGYEREAAIGLHGLFSPIRTRDIYRRWKLFGKLHGLWKPSLFNSTPLERLVEDCLDPKAVRESGKELRVGAYDLERGEYVVYTQNHIPLSAAVLASASYPVAFKPVKVHDRWHSDGGIRTITPIKTLIDMGCTEIDVSICHHLKPSMKFDRSPEALDVALRALDGMGDEILMKDLQIAHLYNELCGSRPVPGKRVIRLRVFSPDEPLNIDSLHFDPAEAAELQLKGYNLARKRSADAHC